MIPSELAEARLAGVQSALELGRSLSSAKGPLLPFSSFEARSLCITGRTTRHALRPGPRTLLGPQALSNEVCFFVSFAGTDIQVGSEFDVLLSAGDGTATALRAVLVGVVPKFGSASLDLIPRGHETFSVVQFPGGIPESVTALPETEGWTHRVVAWLGTRANLERTRR